MRSNLLVKKNSGLLKLPDSSLFIIQWFQVNLTIFVFKIMEKMELYWGKYVFARDGRGYRE